MSFAIDFAAFRDEWLSDVRAGAPSTVDLGHRFATKLLTQWLDVGDTSDDLVFCDGAGDGGIDIAYLDRGEAGTDNADGTLVGHTWYLVQSKYGTAFQGTTTLLQEGQKVIETLDGRRETLSSLAGGLLQRLTNFRKQASDQDRLMLVFATEEPLNEEQKRVLTDLRAMGRGRLGPIFDVETVSIATIYQRTLDEAGNDVPQISVPFRSNLTHSGEELLVGSTTLLDLYAFLRAYREQTGDLDQLYEKNVRRFLGNRGRVNRAMQETLQQIPERFGLYNNGITIVVADFQVEGDETKLIEPYVVNGCQTTRTIWEVCHPKLEAGGTGESADLEAWREKAMQGVVVTKIVKVGADGEDLLQAITRYTNSQNAVQEKDFLALTSDFKTWAKQMETNYDVFLEIQRGGWESRKAHQKQRPSIKQFAEMANAFDLLKVYGAGWYGEAGTAFGRNAAFLPGGTIFRRVIGNASLGEPFGVADLYAAYQLQQAADVYHFGRGAVEQSRRQTRFLFYMAVLELLKDVLLYTSTAITPSNLTQALLKLFAPGNEPAIAAVLDAAIHVIDEYMNQSFEDSVYKEPSYINGFNSDLNAYLKWEQLGKTEEGSPHFRRLINDYRRVLARASGGQEAPLAVITAALK